MAGAPLAEFRVEGRALGRLMPMHLCVSDDGFVTAHGPTLPKLFPGMRLIGRQLFDLIEIRRPGGIVSMAALRARAGERFHFAPLGQPSKGFRGLAMPLADGQGMLLNLSFGIGIVEAVRQHALTDADFAATDLAVELLYLVEAKSAVTEELRALNLRLQGAKSAAEEQALTDTLTGLRNRRGLDLAMADIMGSGAAFGVMHIDLDFFKAVNDSLGHAAGDHVLKEVARNLLAEVRAADTLARVGGDEFVVLFPGLSDPARLTQIGHRMIGRLKQPIDFGGTPCRISASIGMAISSQYATPRPIRMLEDADRALYDAKRAGRERVCLHGHPPGPRV